MHQIRYRRSSRRLGHIVRGVFIPLTLGAFVACGGGGDGGGTGPPDDEPGVVGPDGGTVTIQEAGVTVTVPQGAVSSQVTIEASSTTDVPSDENFVAGSGVELGPDGQQFSTPVTVQLGYSEGGLPSGVPESDLRLGTVENGQWQVVAGSSVNTSSNTVSGSVSHFSVFGAVALSVDAVSASPSSPTISVGETVTLEVTATAGDGTVLGRSASFSSDDESVATVSSSGVVTGQGGGTAVITVNVGGVTTDVTVEVLPAVATVEVTPAEATIQVDGTVTIEATAKDDSGEELDRTITFSSDDESVATVSSSGVVTGQARGTATITVTAGGVSAEVQITVTDPVASVDVTPSEATVQVESTQQLTVTVLGQSGNELDVDVTFSSDDEATATVNAAGLVTAVAPGTATITVTAEGVTATVTITVPLNIADVVGTWTGEWNNTTFGSSGDATFELSVDTGAGTFTAVVDLDGQVFGGSDPDPQTFTGMLNQDGGVSFSGTVPTYGEYTVTADATGSISGTLTNIPNENIESATFTGTITSTTMHFDYTINFSAGGGGGQAVGTVDLTKQAGGGGGDTTVSVGDNFFDPQNVTIQQGGSVTWEHNGAALHNIVPDGHSEWDGQEFPAGSSNFMVTFNSTGTFDYLCQYHVGMEGTITVE